MDPENRKALLTDITRKRNLKVSDKQEHQNQFVGKNKPTLTKRVKNDENLLSLEQLQTKFNVLKTEIQNELNQPLISFDEEVYEKK